MEIVFHPDRSDSVAGLEAVATEKCPAEGHHVLTLTYPCTKCGGQMEFYDDDREINCPHCGSPLTYGR